jgi:hypothetical protein
MNTEKPILVHGIEHPTASEAVQHVDCGPEGHEVAVSIGSRYFSMTKTEFERLQVGGVYMTTWHDVHGTLVSVPGATAKTTGANDERVRRIRVPSHRHRRAQYE